MQYNLWVSPERSHIVNIYLSSGKYRSIMILCYDFLDTNTWKVASEVPRDNISLEEINRSFNR